ncbi:ricin-type beta-trefoil lectin domain protein [Streptomyces sp. NPDC004227]
MRAVDLLGQGRLPNSTGLAGKCLDVAGAGSADGTAVQLYDCNGTAAQQWTVRSDGTIRALGKCLDVTGGSTADGAKVQLWSCTGAANQKWTVTLAVDAWVIMPFDFGGAGRNMGNLTVQSAEGLKNALKNAYRYSDDQAYRTMGISSMNGITDQNETVTVADFRTILGYAQQHHLARLTFWSANRDRPCTGGPADSCSGVGQSAWDYTRVFAAYTG